jgi:glycosyltransferase involved in cell wall biosynthesis
VRAQCPAAEFVLVGEGPMVESLEIFARFGLADAVHFRRRATRHAEDLNELDIVVSSSHSEAMPLAVMEAMVSGVPVVACKVGGIPDLGVTGWLVDAGDCDGLATRVVELLEDEVMCHAMRRAARARALARLSLEQSVDATTRLLAQLTEQPGEPRHVGRLYDAGRPIRTNGAAMKASLRR